MTLSSSDLGTFAEAVHAAETARNGFGLADIAAVPSAWETIEGSVRSFGWIVELRLGGRRYLQCKVHAEGTPQDVAVTALPSDSPLPAARSTALWFEPEPVNRALRHRHAQLAALLNNLP
jgi:hypothetical protein